VCAEDTRSGGELLAYCRAGFEKECGAELQQAIADAGSGSRAEYLPGSGLVLCLPRRGANALPGALRWRELVFARQILFDSQPVSELPREDRIAPLAAAAAGYAMQFADVWVETADTNEAKELSRLATRLQGPLRGALERAQLLAAEGARAPRLHCLLLGPAEARLALGMPHASAPWPMGIPRLRMPREAPSRSTLKLAEAFLSLMSEPERSRSLRPGMQAVDLGAAPGGWTWQLVARHMHVIAVDNGTLAPALLDTGQVRHLREDGFRYRPKKPVDWLTCDIVEQPARIAALVAQWLAQGWTQRAIFNLKLPMKKRLPELERCRAIVAEAMDGAGLRWGLRVKQLYHDREEVTAFLYIRGKGREPV
jgi:23S rRNA (cytidine2498-2'-O)-methyltransferase